MPRTLPRTLIALALATAASIPAASRAQPAPAPAPAAEPRTAETLTAQERDVLAWASQLASESSQLMEQWVTTQAIGEDRLFARMYYPIAKTWPQKYSTPYDAFADRDIVGPEDKALARSPALQYAILTDINAYVPAHDQRFAQPLTGNAADDYVNNRTKRMLPDQASVAAARSEAPFLIQRTRSETGDVIFDLSVPVMVRGKHWGCVRIGYRRTE